MIGNECRKCKYRIAVYREGFPYGPRNVRETCEKRALLARFAHIKSKFLARFREFVYYVVDTFLTRF